MNPLRALSPSALLILPLCGFAASGAPSDFRIELELINKNGAQASFPVQCLEGCDWEKMIIDCPAGESICSATIEGRSGLDASQDRPMGVRALSGSVCIGVGTTSLSFALTSGLRTSPSTGDEEGSVVATVIDASPADLAGFKVGDLVVSFNSVPVRTRRDVLDAMQGMAPGDPFEATLERDETLVQVQGTLGVLTTAHTCAPADARLLQTAITPEELPRFKLIIAAPNWKVTAKCLQGCEWTEAGLSGLGGDDLDPRPSIIIDQRDLSPGYPDQ